MISCPRLRSPSSPRQALEEALDPGSEGAMGGWIHQSRQLFPCGLANEDILCHVDGISWPDPGGLRDVESSLLHSQLFSDPFLCSSPTLQQLYPVTETALHHLVPLVELKKRY